MSFTNHNARTARADGTKKQGNNPPLAKMPANNSGTFPVSLGTTHKSKFGKGVGPSTKTSGASQQGKGGGKANQPANNVTDTKFALGTTKHGVGEVPGYLKAKY